MRALGKEYGISAGQISRRFSRRRRPTAPPKNAVSIPLNGRLVSWTELAKAGSRFLVSRDNEACIAAMFRVHCLFGHTASMLRTPPVSRYKFEYRVDAGSIDLVLFHADHSVSLVEFKAGGTVRDAVAGIGQLFYYESAFMASCPRQMTPVFVRKHLVSPVRGKVAERVRAACSQAGVGFLQYQSFPAIDQHKSELRTWVESLV